MKIPIDLSIPIIPIPKPPGVLLCTINLFSHFTEMSLTTIIVRMGEKIKLEIAEEKLLKYNADVYTVKEHTVHIYIMNDF